MMINYLVLMMYYGNNIGMIVVDVKEKKMGLPMNKNSKRDSLLFSSNKQDKMMQHTLYYTLSLFVISYTIYKLIQ